MNAVKHINSLTLRKVTLEENHTNVCGKALILCPDLSNHQVINSELRDLTHIMNVAGVLEGIHFLQSKRKFMLERSHTFRVQSILSDHKVTLMEGTI